MPTGTGRSTHTRKPRPTRISGTWVAVLASIVVLIILLVFILQNLTGATIHFLGIATTLPLGVAMLFAAIGGAVVVALVGAARILQLRRQAKRGQH
nr:lipopolysaccharide assembly protein LapA domain-containing protein [Saccharothrix tamanrassetensis]